MFVVVLILLIIIFYVIYLKTNHVRKLAANFPGEMDLPLIGNVHQLGFNMHEFLGRLLAMHKKYNYGLFRLFLGPKLFVVLTHPDDMREVLSNPTDFKKSYIYKFFYPWLGQGLISAEGDQRWHNNRKIITPSFHFTILESFTKVMQKEANRLVFKLSSVADGRVINIWDYICLCSLDIITETAMGVSIGAQENSESDLVKSVEVLCGVLMRRILNPLKHSDFLFKFSKDSAAQDKALKVFKVFNENVIKERRSILEKRIVNNNAENENAEFGQKKRIAFLDMLITANIDGKPLTNKEIMDEVSTFIFAGHDTIVSSVSFALYNLANNPEIQSKVLKEQIELLGTDCRKTASFQDVHNMKYLDLVIKESLRMFSTAPFVVREITRDTVMNGRKFPKGTTFILFIYGMHRNPRIYPNPEKFDPDRFLHENRADKHPYEYIPFSAGQRNCIGQKFANVEMKILISNLIRNFEICSAGPENEVRQFISISLKSVNGVNICFKPRKY